MTDPELNKQIRWAAIDYPSREDCHIETTAAGHQVRSVIEGTYNNEAFRLDYSIDLDGDWNTKKLSVNTLIGNRKIERSFDSDGHGHWHDQDGPLPEFEDCIDVDITFTPLTNTLPICRLGLAVGESSEIRVLYVDVAELQFKMVRQRYTRVSSQVYKFENVPNDFEAEIEVDEDGFVNDYPGLFKRI